MAVYEYVCPDEHRFDRTHPMGSAPATTACPACAGPARRAFTAPHLGRDRRGVTAALDTQARSAERPAVVGSVPAQAPVSRPAHPAQRRLPRP